MMRRIFTIFIFALVALCNTAQAQCNYTLELFDSFGDGWNGASLDVSVAGVVTNYTIGAGGTMEEFIIPVNDGDAFIMTYTSGTFENEVTYNLINAENITLFSDGPFPLVGEVYNAEADCPTCLAPTNFTLGTITATSVDLAWVPNPTTNDYNIEYGPEGFTPGTGTVVSATGFNATITDLDENTFYDFYLQADCEVDDQSIWIGPLNAQTGFLNPPSVCYYTLNLFDGSGFGWNNGFVTVEVNGVPTDYAINNIDDNGSEASFFIEVLGGWPVNIIYSPGNFDNQHSYEFIDPLGNLIFEDLGGQPVGGLVFESTGICPSCSSINPNGVEVSGVDVTTASLVWEGQSGSVGYIVEYGPSGYPTGQGATAFTENPAITLTGLNSCIEYEFYVYNVCDVDEEDYSLQVGPYSFTTEAEASTIGDPCTYTVELTDTFGDGWNGSSLSVNNGGVIETFTLDNINDDGSFAIFEINTFGNTNLVFTYTAGAFQNEVLYVIIDNNGNQVFADGTFPATGEVFSEIACPTCQGPTNLSTIDVNANNMTIGWNSANVDPGTLTVEYGPIGFTVGEGTSAVVDAQDGSYLIGGLNENTYYNVYMTYECADGEQAKLIGPLTVHTIYFVDVGITGIANPDPEGACNLAANEDVTVLMTNFGQIPATLIPFGFSVNGQIVDVMMPDDGFYTGVIGNDSTELITFEVQYDFSEPGTYVIEAWTALEDDSDMSNDTFTTIVQTAAYLPLMEDFEDGAIDDDWTTSGFFYAAGAHNLPSAAVGRNLFGTFSSFSLETNRVGPIASNSELTFDYRYTIWSAGTVGYGIQGDSLVLEISTDCGENYDILYAVDSTNHVLSADMATVTVDLSAYEGDAIDLRFRAVYASGDYWLDMDNININGCPPSLGLSGVVTDASQPNEADGSIAVSTTFGSGPFTFEWDTGADGSVLENVQGDASYSVFVTDANGCTDELSFNVGNITGVAETAIINSLTLAPNPTLGEALLNLDMNESSDLRIEVYNAVGQLMNSFEYFNTQSVQQMINLNDQPAGVYYIRVSANGQSQVKKLMVTRA